MVHRCYTQSHGKHAVLTLCRSKIELRASNSHQLHLHIQLLENQHPMLDHSLLNKPLLHCSSLPSFLARPPSTTRQWSSTGLQAAQVTTQVPLLPSQVGNRRVSRSQQRLTVSVAHIGHAQQPAGFNQTAGYARTTPAGVPLGAGGVPAAGAYHGTSDVPHDAQDVPQPAPPPHVPFYKKRWFIISQLIIIPLGIALLFILLFPVIKAIAQLVVNRSTLDIQVAQITEPLNNTYVLVASILVSILITRFIGSNWHYKEM